MVDYCRPLHRGCGLKSGWFVTTAFTVMSPSSQRVWIEIQGLRKPDILVDSRPLHRGCGLKFYFLGGCCPSEIVALFTEGVD